MSVDLGIGISSQADVWAAGQEAAQQMVAHLAGRQPDITFVFCSIRFADPRLLKGIRAVTGKAPLLGCTDAGCITTSGPRRRSVTVIGLISKGGYFRTALGRNISQNPRKVGEALAYDLKSQGIDRPKAVMLFPDGLATNGSDIVSGLQKGLGTSIPVAGGAAADDFYFQRTFQFYNDEILSNSVPAVLLGGNMRVGIGVRHGWVPVGRPRKVTRSSGHIIYQLDGRPAISIYEDYLGIKREELLQEPLANVTITYPLGTEAHGQSEYLLRDAIRVGRAGSLICTGDIAQGSEVCLMIGGYESALEAAQQAACDAADRVGRSQLNGALVFCSVARQKMLGSEFQGEIDVIRDALGGAGLRLGGFYTYGEIAPAGSKWRPSQAKENVFHNESVVVVGLG